MKQSHYYRRSHIRKIKTARGTKFIQITHRKVTRTNKRKK